MSEPILKVQNLGVSFDGNHVLKDLDFLVSKGDVLAIVGPNGAGKSVLFRAPWSYPPLWSYGMGQRFKDKLCSSEIFNR